MSILLKYVCGIWIIVTRHYRKPELYGETKFGYPVSSRISSDKSKDYRMSLSLAERWWHQ